MCYTTLTGVDTIKIQIDVEDDKKRGSILNATRYY